MPILALATGRSLLGFSVAPIFIDATNGLDTNTGKDPSQAWKTIAQLNSYAGWSRIIRNVVLFKRDGVWPETLKIAAKPNNLTLDAYGTGANPLIKGADELVGATWTNTSGNVWQIARTTQVYNLHINGTRGTVKTSTATLLAQGDFYWASNVLYIYATSNPSTAYTSIEAGTRYACIDTFYGRNWTIQNLTCEKANKTASGDGYGIYVQYSDNIRILNCILRESYYSGVITYGDVIIQATAFVENCQLYNNGAWGYSDGDGTTIANGWADDLSTVKNCQVSGNGWRNMISGGIYGFLKEVSGNEIYNNGLGGTSFLNLCHNVYINTHQHTVVIKNNHVYGALSSGIQSKAAGEISYNRCHDNGKAGIVIGESATDVTYSIHHNTLYLNKYGLDMGRFSQAGNLIVNAYHNTFYVTDTIGQDALHVADVIAELHFKNNILSVNTRLDYELIGIPTVWEIDYNVVHRIATSGNFSNWGGTNQNKATWIAAGRDVHSAWTDPLFNNPGNADFTLQAGSPAINLGTLIPGVNDVFLGTAPDAGALEAA